ncbi:MAG: phosphoglucosamine mutase [Phycisphaerae bacterium]|nr:phosphoglucosamine mutase [Phycisphaerae bacterium]
MPLIISVSGMRGFVGSDLGAPEALKVGRIYGRLAANDGKPFVVASDSRISSDALRSAVIAGLLAAGADVIDIGVAATPTACLTVRRHAAAGGVIVTASHNPIQWNGIKLIGPDALAVDAQRAEQIKTAFHQDPPEHASATECGRLKRDDQAHQTHVQAVLAASDPRLIDDLRYRKVKVVLDSINGAGAHAGTMLLNALGCEVCGLNAEPTGRFAHTPEPIPENLTSLCQEVTRQGAQVGFAQDPDADRLALVDETGRCIGEEYTLALAAWAVLAHRAGPLATNLSTSRMVDDVAQWFGQKVIRTPVGEAHVARAVMQNNCPVGGEGNGGVIVPDVVPVRDSLSAMALVLQLMVSRSKTISQLVSELPKYQMVKAKFECSREKAAQVCQRLVQKYADQKIDTADGVRIDFPDERAWVHIRPSNTEPIIRIIAEARDQARADELVDMLAAETGR